MTDLNLLVDERRSAADVLAMWLPRAAFALFFLAIGSEKFAAHTMWVRVFARIGIGQWFRYFTGVMQITGAVCLLVPPLPPLGFALLGCTMAGAVAFWVVVAGQPFAAIIPGLILAGIVGFGWASVAHAVRNLRRRPVSN